MFIDKVRHLEQQNKVLEMELVTLRQKQSEPSRVTHLYQQEMRDLRSQVEELSRDKNRILIERNNMEDELQVKPLGSFEEDKYIGRFLLIFVFICCILYIFTAAKPSFHPEITHFIHHHHHFLCVIQ